ncbi:MAG: 4-hydroxy-tetrahydrodipicolinate synthase [Saprospiraceae bacterium]|nr:4-hydroxy-tetrahydrodipicolinate synthase [Saprospiraceae bacterium]
MSMNLTGTGVAIVTPFHEDGSIHFEQLRTLINHLIDNGINYIVSLGTTGESVTLTKEEKVKLVRQTIEFVDGRIPVVVGAGGNNTASVIDEIKLFDSISGIDAYLSVAPYYSKPSQKGFYAHYAAVAQATERAIILYNVPGRTGKNMEAATALKLGRDFENIIAIKEAGNNMVQSQYLVKHKPEDFFVVSGDDDLLLGQMACGFDGVISVVANAYPKHWSDMVYQASENNYDSARQINYALLDFVKYAFAENNPAGIKCALKHLGLCNDYLRLPLVNVEAELETKIEAFVKQM